MNDLSPDEMRTEAALIAHRRPDVIRTDESAPVPAVIVTMQDGSQIAVHHYPWDVEVDWRAHPSHHWSPIAFWGGSIEIRPQSVELLPCQEDVGRTDEVRTGAKVTVIHGGAA